MRYSKKSTKIDYPGNVKRIALDTGDLNETDYKQK